MLQLRQQRRLAAAEALNLPAAAGSADSSASSNPANQFYSVSNGNNDVDSSGISSSVDTPLLPHQQLNIVGPPERSPLWMGGEWLPSMRTAPCPVPTVRWQQKREELIAAAVWGAGRR